MFAQNENKRINQIFNFDWKFKMGEQTNAEKTQYNDSDWLKLDLPHDFQINEPWDETAGGARGFKKMSIGWYRKSFKADPNWIGRRIILDFEGIMSTGDIWLNGKKIGGTDYGYLGFETDISNYIRFDTLNVVSVRADTGKKSGSRWYTGGGIYRDVHLIVKDKISIARHGIFVSTPEVSRNKAEVNVQVELEGIRRKQFNLEIVASVFSPDGKLVAENKVLAPKNSNLSTSEIKLPFINIEKPALWSCESPQLYTVKIGLYLEGKEVDELSQKFGIRSIEFNKESGLLLNGEKVFLKGIANHQDLGALGVATYEFAIAREMDKLKAFGFNHIRTSHNPYSETFLRLADEKGILIVDELYDKWSNESYWIGRKPWTELWYENIPEWIKRDRNHPSVILWSFGNELQMREDLCGFPTGDWGVTTYRILDVLAKRYDPTRKTTVAMYPARAGAIGKNDPDFNIKIYPPELATVTDVSSFNYRWLNYQEYLKHTPDMIIYQSEATTNELLAPYFGMDREKMVGLAYWGAISYWGESNGWPKKGWDYSFFDHSLEPSPQAYLIKSAFSEKSEVHIGIVEDEGKNEEWNEQTSGTQKINENWNLQEGKTYNIYTYTNAEEVELFVNKKSIGIQKNSSDINTRNRILWRNVPYSAGKLTAIARNSGKEVAKHQIETTEKATSLKIEAENTNLKADGMDLQYVKVYAIDSKGRKVYSANGEVTFEISGPANLYAVDNGDHYSNAVFEGNKVQMHHGFAMAILRSGIEPGKVKIKVNVSGFKPNQIIIQSTK